ncbi:MT-A70-domain-containing protein [Dactylonectria macrodidyma]|uniref:MT-A70-domain-containing protein n=1 Tax=Dactylonectria macrodidyma TaxID=307937 RepID=A0A9P9JD13_9HYPO|nr:MT-A70-domain-containing protein [Dactylonectria macrodidyma]
MGNDSVLVAAPCEVDDSKSSSQGNKITGSSSEKNTTTTISSPPTKSILFESRDKALVLIDVPRSLEESQVLAAETPRRRIVSVEPPATPYATPEPRHGARNSHQAASLSSPGAQLAELMTTAAVQGALQDLVSSYPGPFHLARFLGPPHPPLISGLPAHLPPKAEPLQGSIQQLRESFDASAPNFDLVVLDPPWPNRSARRRTDKYATARNLNEMRELLLQIPLASHLSPDSLVAVWVTNKHSIHDFLASPTGLFAAWGLEVVTEWTWVKVTTTGEPLFDVESTWRKPWEKLIIAKRVGHKRPDALKPKVIVAVPDVHSRKPNLRGLFQDILGESFLGLEVFARNLTAGWWGWGDQVLHFQQVEHWSSEDDV